ncbi:MAG TPA: class I SAM-dependent methyltransferase [Patescibacteria group bacterium]|nr:hypothetical protein [Candidatus Woesebacteria bacterium]HLD90161.1 class I SAM-dependent methyltransferase [Patescibacteria group bacterium]
MYKKMNFTLTQGKFYDKHPVFLPWSQVLIKHNLKLLYRLKEIYIKKDLDKLGMKKGSSVLEVGSGQGIFLNRLSSYYNVIALGVDVSDDSIKYANKYCSDNNLKFIKASATNLPFKDKNFDTIVSFDTMEHVKNQNKMLSEIIRVLKQNGKFLVYTLNSKDDFTLDWFWAKIGFDIYKRAMHKRELFVDSHKMINDLKDMGIKSLKINYYGGLFTIGFDEILMVFLLVLGKLGLFKYDLLGEVIFYVLDKLSRIIYPAFNYLDSFWYKKGYSLGFSVSGTKE